MVNYQQIAQKARLNVLDLIYKAQSSHIGSNFSAIDIMAVLFEKINLDKDRFILSAGWKAASLYYFLWKKGRITEEQLNSYCQDGSPFIGLAEPIHPDIPFAGGSMGFGLPASVGFALSKKLNKLNGTIYCLISDGEVAIGTTWESALIATHHKLDNLIVFVDINGFQAMGETSKILDLGDLQQKWVSLGFQVMVVDGHDYEKISLSLEVSHRNKPLVILAVTTKGKGVSFMENNNLYHYKMLTENEYRKAKKQLNGNTKKTR